MIPEYEEEEEEEEGEDGEIGVFSPELIVSNKATTLLPSLNLSMRRIAGMVKQPVLEGGRRDSVGDHAKLGVVTVSDRASIGVYEDLSGPAILNFFSEAVDSR
jgi:hypothetical protein